MKNIVIVYLLGFFINSFAVAEEKNSVFKMENQQHNEIDYSKNEKIVEVEIKKDNEDVLFVQDKEEFNVSELDKKISFLNLKDVQELVSNGFDINKKNQSQNGNTLIMIAGSYNKIDVFNYLISKKPNLLITNNDKQNILHKISQEYSRNANFIKQINLTGKDVLKKLINEKDNKGRTPLHYALLNIRNFNKDYVIELLSNGADVNIADNAGQTPTHFLIFSGKVDLIDLIYKKYNADFNKKDKEGISPLELSKIHFINLEQKQHFEKF